MTRPALSRTNSGSSSQTCNEKASSLDNPNHYNIGLPHSSFESKPSASRASGNRKMLAKAVQRLRCVMSAVQNMSCVGTCGNRSRELNRSQLYLNPQIQEKFQAQHNTPTPEFVETKGSSSSIHERPVPSMDLPHNAHILAPSTNMAYKPSALFSDETLQFANAFLPSMEPLKIWGDLTSVESSVKPSARWARRHTCIRPGNVVQIPSVSDKAIYLLSCQNESEWRCSVGNSRSQKLFVAQADGGARPPLGYSRAFIMCKPGSES
ncbi:hypothetical protein RSOL_112850 [Rhizoctonia solani AG-3 Rhs1AP]|uniref:Uncharacterized protein n=1 Tax=Rhizoctonia solani AG-3 Rhs1AP TaxID=1086054 RepID=X8J1L1_9AGAM|nr:hypothetical protein RSOL_112850 [Rhizoctonia solani AG-3 Rhs1AP]